MSFMFCIKDYELKIQNKIIFLYFNDIIKALKIFVFVLLIYWLIDTQSPCDPDGL